MKNQHFDCLAVGVVDFSRSAFSSFEYHATFNRFFPCEFGSTLCFDLASLTKPFTLGALWSSGVLNTAEAQWAALLNHRSGLPACGFLSKCSWRQDLMALPLQTDAPTIYSDFGYLRLQAEVELTHGRPLIDLWRVAGLGEFFTHWQELRPAADVVIPPTGERYGRAIVGEVNDHNAYNLATFTAHAGLFASVEQICRFLIAWQQRYHFIDQVVAARTRALVRGERHRFVMGWDFVEDPQNTLAGAGCSEMTFGHLGFTGTSVWIDAKAGFAQIILTNATKNRSYDRSGLNELRRTLGAIIWRERHLF